MHLFLVYLCGFGICLALTPAVRAAAKRWGLVDRPDGRRKIHKSPVPVAGGVAVYLAACLTIGIGLWRSQEWRDLFGARALPFIGLFVAATIIAIVGIIDDCRGLRARYKLAGQFLAVSVVIACGLTVDRVRILDGNFELGVLAIPITALWLLGAINSLNLIDGMDGLLGSVGLIICLAMSAMAFMNEQIATSYVAMALAGALLGFLWFNFPPASIFLGDAGSMLIGLVIGTLAIHASLKGPATVAMAAPIALMVIPFFDTSAAIVRRTLTGRSIFTTDRGHLHHCLMGTGLSNRRVLFVVSVLCGLTCAGVLTSVWLKSELLAIICALAVVVTLVASRLFGHAEYLLVKDRLKSVVHTLRSGTDNTRQSSVHLQGSADWTELWRELTTAAESLRLKTIHLDVNAPAIHEGFNARWDGPSADRAETNNLWRAEFPLVVNQQVIGRLEVTGARDGRSVCGQMMTLDKVLDYIESSIAAMAADRATARSADTPLPVRPPRLADELHLERV